MTNRSLSVVGVGIAVASTLLSTTSTATSPVSVPWSYPALDGLCLLEAAAAVDGISAAYPVGATVVSKHGKWICTSVIARQSPVVTAGVWVQQGAK